KRNTSSRMNAAADEKKILQSFDPVPVSQESGEDGVRRGAVDRPVGRPVPLLYIQRSHHRLRADDRPEAEGCQTIPDEIAVLFHLSFIGKEIGSGRSIDQKIPVFLTFG